MTATVVVAPAMGQSQVGQFAGTAPRSWYEVIDRRLPRANRVRLDGLATQPAPPAVALGNAGELHVAPFRVGRLDTAPCRCRGSALPCQRSSGPSSTGGPEQEFRAAYEWRDRRW